jgi:hypothetical protein
MTNTDSNGQSLPKEPPVAGEEIETLLGALEWQRPGQLQLL